VEDIIPAGVYGRNIATTLVVRAPDAMIAAVGRGARRGEGEDIHVSPRTVDASGRRLLALTIGFGVLVGVLFPFIAWPFVEYKSTTLAIAFAGMCVAAGSTVGFAAYLMTRKSTERVLKQVIRSAGTTLGVATHDAVSVDDATAELERVLSNVTSMITQLRSANVRLRGLATEILAATEEQVAGAAEQAAAVTQTSATVEELAQTSKQIADNSEAVVRVAERTLASAEQGMTAVSDTAAGIEDIRVTTMQSSDRILQLGERSQEIGRVLTIIDEIAEQTKILALNAAIEAARAGEAGKGFAVVAGEIRKLADSVTESTQEIGRVVREIQASTSALVMSTEKAAKKVDEGKELAGRTADALDRIVSHVEETTDAAKQISIATQQQRTASDQVVLSMREVAQVSRQSAESSRQVSQAVMELDSLTDALQVG
jgi:methyl-accepting chemotaxis protein